MAFSRRYRNRIFGSHISKFLIFPTKILFRVGEERAKRKGKLEAYAMKRVAAGARLPTPWLFGKWAPKSQRVGRWREIFFFSILPQNSSKKLPNYSTSGRMWTFVWRLMLVSCRTPFFLVFNAKFYKTYQRMTSSHYHTLLAGAIATSLRPGLQKLVVLTLLYDRTFAQTSEPQIF